MKNIKLMLCVLLASMFTLSVAAQDEHRQGRPGGFKPSLEGVWQQCSLTPGQDGQPALSFYPLLKVYTAEGNYQYIGIPGEGACFVQNMGRYEKTSDSTLVETRMRMPHDSVEVQPQDMHYRFRGPVWLVIDYQEAGKAERTTEVWMKVQPQGRHRGGQMGGQPNGQRPRMGGQRGQGRGGMRGGFNRQMQQNPFMENGGDAGGGSPDFGREYDG